MCCFWCFGVDIGADFGVDIGVGIDIDIGVNVPEVLEASWFYSSWVSWCFLDTGYLSTTIGFLLALLLVGAGCWLMMFGAHS